MALVQDLDEEKMGCKKPAWNPGWMPNSKHAQREASSQAGKTPLLARRS